MSIRQVHALSLAVALLPLAAFAQGNTTQNAVRGVVYDSIGKAPLGGAIVQFTALSGEMAGRGFSSQAEPNGSFGISGVPVGKYAVGFYHPALDSLGIEAPIVTFDLTNGIHRLNLATPSPHTLMKALCPASDTPDSAMVIGHVRETSSEQPIAGAKVTVEWSETVIDARGIRNRDRIGRAETVGPGWFAICEVAPDVPLLLHAAHGADSSGYVEVEVPAGSVRHVSFLVGGASLVPSPGIDTAALIRQNISFARVWLGKARLTGTVYDAHGKPVPNAHVLVWDAGRPEAVTNDQGAFFLDGLPGGTHTVETKVIGYVPVHTIVQLAEDRPAEQRIELGESAQMLPTVAVRSNIVFNRKLVEYQRHRLHSFGGFFINPEDLDRRPSTQPSALVQGLSGVTVDHRQGVTTVTMKAFKPGIDLTGRSAFDGCTPTLYIDGFKSLLDFDALDGFYRSDDFLAIEVYPRELERPQEFQDVMNNCGAIAFWTRAAPVNPRKIKGLKPPPSPPAW